MKCEFNSRGTRQEGMTMKVLTPNDVGPEVLDEPCVVIVQTSVRCHPCRKMYPWLDKLAVRFADKAKVVLVTAHKDERPMRYVRDIKKLNGWPYTAVYKNGKLVGHFFGFVSEHDYCSKVADLVG